MDRIIMNSKNLTKILYYIILYMLRFNDVDKNNLVQ